MGAADGRFQRLRLGFALSGAPINKKGNAMSDTYELKAEARERVGKGSARELRRNGKIPAVIYGDKQPPLAITVPYKEIFYKIHGGGFMTTVTTIDVDGQKIKVLPKDYQLDPVRDFPMHVDFLRVSKHTEVNVNVPVRFINEEKAPGIKRGGVLNIVRHDVEMLCPAENIPDFIEGDLSALDIHDSLHISDFALPEGVVPTIRERDFTVASIVAPTSVIEEQRAAAAAAAAAASAPVAEEGAAAPAEGAALAAGAAPAAGAAKAPAAPAKK